MTENLKNYLRAAAAVGDVTLGDAFDRLMSLDGATIGELLDDFYTGDDTLYDDVAEELGDLIERAGDKTPISTVLADT